MMVQELPNMRRELERSIRARTGRRIRDLNIELRPEQIILRGRAATYHLKQLAQHGVRDLLPHISLQNAIEVDGSIN
jgi:hypothetical protein